MRVISKGTRGFVKQQDMNTVVSKGFMAVSTKSSIFFLIYVKCKREKFKN